MGGWVHKGGGRCSQCIYWNLSRNKQIDVGFMRVDAYAEAVKTRMIWWEYNNGLRFIWSLPNRWHCLELECVCSCEHEKMAQTEQCHQRCHWSQTKQLTQTWNNFLSEWHKANLYRDEWLASGRAVTVARQTGLDKKEKIKREETGKRPILCCWRGITLTQARITFFCQGL